MVVSATYRVDRPFLLSLGIPHKKRDEGILPTRGETLTEVLDLVEKETVECFQKLGMEHNNNNVILRLFQVGTGTI